VVPDDAELFPRARRMIPRSVEHIRAEVTRSSNAFVPDWTCSYLQFIMSCVSLQMPGVVGVAAQLIL